MAETTVNSAYDSSKISQLVGMAIKAETNRVASLQTEKTRLSRLQSVTATLKTSLSSLRTAVSALTESGALGAKKTVSSDALVLEGSASASASAGAYSLNVTSLAAAHKLGSASLADTGGSVLAAEGEGVRTFRLTVGGVSEDISVTLAAGDNDNAALAKIMDAVNAGSAKVKASLIKETSSSTTLVLESAQSGLSNQVTISDVTGNLLRSAGVLTALGANARQLQGASDAVFTIGGTITVTRSSNEVGDAVTGVTINLKKEGAATLTVAPDSDAVAAKFTAFVNAYNAAQSAIGAQLAEAASETDPSKGVFYNNRQLRALRSGLRLRLAETREQDYSSLAAIGLKPVDVKTSASAQSYNITLDQAALKKALQEKPDQVLALIAGETGMLALAKSDLDGHLAASSGTFAWLESSAAGRVSAVDRRLQLAQKAVTQRTAYYTALYTSLAGKISTMQTQSSTAASIYGSVFGTSA